MLVGIGTLALPILIKLLHINYAMPYHFTNVFGYYLFFMPFMVNVLFGHHLLEPLWSIGVEELFYLSWAPAIKVFRKHILSIIIITISIKLALSIGLYFSNVSASIKEVVGMLQFEAMGIGGLGAYIIFNRQKDIKEGFIFSKAFQVLMFVFIISYVLFWKELSAFSDIFKILWTTPLASHILMMLVFCWLIINISLNENSLVKLNGKKLNFLGEISYGIYMYHMLVVFGVVVILSKVLNHLNPVISTIVFYIIITSGTVIVSYLSKRFFEEPFLRLKHRLEK